MPLDSRARNPLYSQSWPSPRVQDHCTMQAGSNNWNGARVRRRWACRRASLGLGAALFWSRHEVQEIGTGVLLLRQSERLGVLFMELWPRASGREMQVALTAEKSATETVSGDVRRSDDQMEVDR